MNTPDHRQVRRWQINWQAKIKLEGQEGFTNCAIYDISFKGIKVCLPYKLQTDTFLKLSVCVSEECVLAEVEAWVAWHKTIEGRNVYGLYFNKIKDVEKEKIYRFLRRNFLGEVNKQWWQGPQEKGGETMEDQRIFERFEARFPLRFLNLSDNKEGQGRTQDISAKGVGIVTHEELKPNTPLELWLQIPDRGEPLYMRGEVVWSISQGIDEYRTGINLEKAELMGLSRVLRVE
jgi:hypothetical protein